MPADAGTMKVEVPGLADAVEAIQGVTVVVPLMGYRNDLVELGRMQSAHMEATSAFEDKCRENMALRDEVAAANKRIAELEGKLRDQGDALSKARGEAQRYYFDEAVRVVRTLLKAGAWRSEGPFFGTTGDKLAEQITEVVVEWRKNNTPAPGLSMDWLRDLLVKMVDEEGFAPDADKDWSQDQKDFASSLHFKLRAAKERAVLPYLGRDGLDGQNGRHGPIGPQGAPVPKPKPRGPRKAYPLNGPKGSKGL